MKNIILKTFCLSAFFILTSCASNSVSTDTPQLAYTSTRLKVMDLEEMTDLLQGKAKEFKKTDNSQFLKDGLLICLSRPDEDSVIEKVMSSVKTPLEDHGLWESAVEELVDNAISSIKNETANGADQVTYSVALENLISEFKPQFVKQYKSPGFEARIIEKIAAADLSFTSQAKAERGLNLMRSSLSPSMIAKRLVEHRNEFLEKEKDKKD